MKKILLFAALLAFVWNANAQNVLLNEGFEGDALPAGWTALDADGDGYNWEIVSDSNGYNVHEGTQCMASASYDNATHAALHPDNYLITPAVTLAHAAELSFHVVSQQSTYPEHYGVCVSTTGTDTSDFALVYENESPADYQEIVIDLSAYTGTIHVAFRHFNTSDQFMLNIDDIKITEYDNPYITTDLSILDFGQLLIGSGSILPVNVTAYNLTQPITAAVDAPFSVSCDSITFGTTATIAAAGGTLYVQYLPTAAGGDSSDLVLSSTGADSDTVSVKGQCADCSNDIILPYTQGFENGMPLCYTLLDADGDGNNWDVYEDFFPHSGLNGLVSEVNADTNDNWLILSPFAVSSDSIELSFYISDFISFDNYGVYISTAGTDIADFAPLLEATTPGTGEYELQTLDLTGYTGQTVYIAFRHYNPTADSYALLLDDISIVDAGTGSTTLYVDYALDGFVDEEGHVVQEIAVGPGEGVSPTVVITNNGPDVPAPADTVFFDIAINGAPTGASLQITGADIAALTAGLQAPLGLQGEDLYTAADLDAMGLTGSFTFSLTVRIAGEAQDTVAANNTATITITRDSGTGTDDMTDNKPAVYPNPAADHVHIDNAGNAAITLFDLGGKAVLNDKTTSENHILNVSNLPQGIYLLRIQEDSQVTTTKISIVR